MNYKIKRGTNNNYIVSIHNSFSAIGINSYLKHIKSFSWRNKKFLIIIESESNSVISLEMEEWVTEQINLGNIIDCVVINLHGSETSLENFNSIESFISRFNKKQFEDAAIFIQGGNELLQNKLSKYLLYDSTSTRLEVNLDAITHNLEYYKSKTVPQSKVMAMVKANAYGHGLIEVAQYLKNQVDYLGVAYVNEGIILRNQNIKTPIMVMNPSHSDIDLCIVHDLEPEIHNIKTLSYLVEVTNKHNTTINIQLEINTGMNRLGIDYDELDQLISLLKKAQFIHVNGIYSHLACAEDPEEDDFNKQQLKDFNTAAAKIESELGIKTIKHIRNSAGTLRYPESPTDMIRLGIGLYGVDSNKLFQDKLKNVGVLKTTISQIRDVAKGETIGYNRTFTAENDIIIATIAIGYADGFKRSFSNGKGNVIINGNTVPVVGRVNMDMTMIDITGLNVEEGDEVIIFNNELHVSTLAINAETIPYEIFTSIGERVGREYLVDL